MFDGTLTRKGRVVYDRKKNFFSWTSIERIVRKQPAPSIFGEQRESYFIELGKLFLVDVQAVRKFYATAAENVSLLIDPVFTGVSKLGDMFIEKLKLQPAEHNFLQAVVEALWGFWGMVRAVPFDQATAKGFFGEARDPETVLKELIVFYLETTVRNFTTLIEETRLKGRF